MRRIQLDLQNWDLHSYIYHISTTSCINLRMLNLNFGANSYLEWKYESGNITFWIITRTLNWREHTQRLTTPCCRRIFQDISNFYIVTINLNKSNKNKSIFRFVFSQVYLKSVSVCVLLAQQYLHNCECERETNPIFKQCSCIVHWQYTYQTLAVLEKIACRF